MARTATPVEEAPESLFDSLPDPEEIVRTTGPSTKPVEEYHPRIREWVDKAYRDDPTDASWYTIGSPDRKLTQDQLNQTANELRGYGRARNPRATVRVITAENQPNRVQAGTLRFKASKFQRTPNSA